MAVQRSPFSRQNVVTNTGYGFDKDGNPIYTRNDGTVVLLSGSSVGNPKVKLLLLKKNLFWKDKQNRLLQKLQETGL
jgi:hypothetical protein